MVIEEFASSPTVEVAADYEAMSRTAAQYIRTTLRSLTARFPERTLNVIFSAGNTPTRTYELLADSMRGEVDWNRLTLFQMDDYVDIARSDQTLNAYLRRHVVDPLQLQRAHLLDPPPPRDTAAWSNSIREQETLLRSRGGIDLVVHGIGTNGHLGFNEPGTDLDDPARIVTLAESTQAAFTGSTPPTHGVTLGLSTLLAAKVTLLLASGTNKAAAIHHTLDSPPTTACPASFLQNNRAVTVIIDRDAASKLKGHRSRSAQPRQCLTRARTEQRSADTPGNRPTDHQ